MFNIYKKISRDHPQITVFSDHCMLLSRGIDYFIGIVRFRLVPSLLSAYVPRGWPPIYNFYYLQFKLITK